MVAVEVKVAVEATKVEALRAAVEARVRELIEEEKRTKAIIEVLEALFGEVKERAPEAGYEVITIAPDGYTLKVHVSSARMLGFTIRLDTYKVETWLDIWSPREPWELEAPGEAHREPKAVINRAVLDVIRPKLEPLGFRQFVHVADYCSNCNEDTKVRFGFCREDVPVYVFVEETYRCRCVDP